MSQHELYIVELEAGSGARVSDALTHCGPNVDRAAVQSVVAGRSELPALIATGSHKVQLLLISQALESAGCTICLVEGTEGRSVRDRLARLGAALRDAPTAARQVAAEALQSTREQILGLVGSRPWQKPPPGSDPVAPEETAEHPPAAREPHLELRVKPLAVALRLVVLLLLIGAGAALVLAVADHQPRDR